MDTNHVLLWTVLVMTVTGLVSAVRAGPYAGRGWRIVLVGVLTVTVLTHAFAPERSGFVGAGLVLLFVLVPSWGGRFLARLVAAQRYREAHGLSRFLAILHPLDGWTQQPALFAALAAWQSGRRDEAVEALRRLAASGSAEARRTATLHLLRVQGSYAELRAWMDSESSGFDPRRDPASFTTYLRALGEAGELNRLVTALEASRALLDSQAFGSVRPLANLFVFAMCGRTEATARLLSGPLSYYAPQVRELWQLTAELTAGRDGDVRRRLEELARDPDGIIRQSARDRLDRPLAVASTVLTERSEQVLRELEIESTLAERYDPRAAPASRPWATYALVGLNVAYFLVELAFGGAEDPFVLYRLGAAVSPLDMEGAWRLLASTFLHFGALHLVMNMAGLLVIGPYVERALGRPRYVALYVASGVVAAFVVVSMASADRPAFLVGASASVLGLLGGTAAVLLDGWRRHRARPASRRLRGILAIVVLQTAFDLSTPMVSWRAHAAGMVAGFLIALLLPGWRKGESPSGVNARMASNAPR